MTEMRRFDGSSGSLGTRSWRSAKPRTCEIWPLRRPACSMRRRAAFARSAESSQLPYPLMSA